MASLIVALVVVESSRAQQNAPAAPTFRSRTDTVALDVVVLDRNGNPITNLDESEFEVFEDRVRRPITTFTVVNFADVATKPVFDDVETDVATNTEPEGRLFIIALDEITSGLGSMDLILTTRRVLRDFINQSFGPNDVAAVVLVGRGSVQTGQDFTNSKRRLLQAIERYSGGWTIDNPSDTLTGLTYNQYREINQLGSLRDLVEFLGTLPARRKALLYMSTGFTHRLDVGQVLGAASGARTLREFCHERIEPGPNVVSCRPSQELHRVLVAAARGNVAIYPISPAGNQGVGRDYNFLDLAAATGGLAITDTNPRPLMQQIARENGAYYRLGIESGHKAQDGKIVPVVVRVTRPGVKALSRTSYVARFPDEKEIETTDTSTLRGALASPLATPGIPLRVTTPVFRDAKGAGLIAVTVEIDPRHLVDAGDLELSYLATDVHRRVHRGGGYRIKVSAKPAAPRPAGTQASTSTARIIMPMTLASGRYQVRVAAATQGRTGGVVSDVEVPDFDEDLTMSSIAVSSSSDRTATFWPAGRQAAGPMSWALTTRREFTRDETLSVKGELYLRGRRAREPVRVKVTLRDEVGVSASAERDVAATSGAASFAFDLPLRQTRPGTQVLTITATPAGAPPTWREIPVVLR